MNTASGNTSEVSILYNNINYWERLSRLEDRPNRVRRTTLAPPTPASRVLSLEAELQTLKLALAEACFELRKRL